MARIVLDRYEFGAGEHVLPDHLVHGLIRDYPENITLLEGTPKAAPKPPPGAVLRRA